MSRYLMNSPDDFVLESLEGLTMANRDLVVMRDPLFVRRSTLTPGKVGLLSGGGTGHEPLHAGFVGEGMLDAAVPGAVFASPTALQVAKATQSIDSGAGVLHIVKNYTGDVLNFSIAAELCADEGVEVETVIVDDDLATDIEGSRVGRRGTGATLVVEKLCGAACQKGNRLGEVAELGRSVVRQSRSLALALDACTNPITGRKSFELPRDEVEFGVGIHGERGRGRIPFGSADELVSALALPLLEALHLQGGARVIALVNSLGATHTTEQYVVTRALHRLLASHGVIIERTLTGAYVTALDMSGVSITLTRVDDELLALWDAPVNTTGLRW
ncbi:MAG: dihydroxyacetone kinase subunit DhaK [Microbacterium sp.]